MTPTLSLLHATRWRPEKAIACMKLWMSRADKPGDIEYIIAYERDDVASDVAFEKALEGATDITFGSVAAIRGDFGGSAPAWNAAFSASSGSLLVQVSDDFEPPENFDTALLNRLPPMWEKERLVIAVADGIRRDNLMTMAICTRAYANWKGEFLHPKYLGLFSDDDFTFRSFKHQSEGNCRVIPSKDLLFLHRHHCVNPDVPNDDTYEWQSRTEAYVHGKKLFLERNPHAYGTEAKLWM